MIAWPSTAPAYGRDSGNGDRGQGAGAATSGRRTALRWLRAALTAAVVVVVGLGWPRPSTPAVDVGSSPLTLVCLVVVAGGTFALLCTGPDRWWPAWTTVAVITVMTAGCAGLLWLTPNQSGLLGGLVVIGTGASRLPTRAGLVVAGVVIVGLVGAGVAGGKHSTSSLAVSAAALVPLYALGRYARLLRARTAEAERLLHHLERTREAETRAAALAERQRLAREMHDVLAHSLSGLLVHLEAARLLAVRSDGPPELARALGQAHHLAQSGLIEARRAIGLLRDEGLPGPDRLAELAERFEHDTGVLCRLLTTGTPVELAPEQRLTVYRAAQEALTNVRRHAAMDRLDRVDLRLDYAPGATTLTVEDVGAAAVPEPGDALGDTAPTPAPESESAGYGLVGMRERAELVGGTLTAGATDTGFRVELRLPG